MNKSKIPPKSEIDNILKKKNDEITDQEFELIEKSIETKDYARKDNRPGIPTRIPAPIKGQSHLKLKPALKSILKKATTNNLKSESYTNALTNSLKSIDGRKSVLAHNRVRFNNKVSTKPIPKKYEQMGNAFNGITAERQNKISKHELENLRQIERYQIFLKEAENNIAFLEEWKDLPKSAKQLKIAEVDLKKMKQYVKDKIPYYKEHIGLLKKKEPLLAEAKLPAEVKEMMEASRRGLQKVRDNTTKLKYENNPNERKKLLENNKALKKSLEELDEDITKLKQNEKKLAFLEDTLKKLHDPSKERTEFIDDLDQIRKNDMIKNKRRPVLRSQIVNQKRTNLPAGQSGQNQTKLTSGSRAATNIVAKRNIWR